MITNEYLNYSDKELIEEHKKAKRMVEVCSFNSTSIRNRWQFKLLQIETAIKKRKMELKNV